MQIYTEFKIHNTKLNGIWGTRKILLIINVNTEFLKLKRLFNVTNKTQLIRICKLLDTIVKRDSYSGLYVTLTLFPTYNFHLLYSLYTVYIKALNLFLTLSCQ